MMVLLLLLVLSLCRGGSKIRIIGGSSAISGQFPWHVEVDIGRALCSGSIIGDKFVLTAAHCLNVDQVR
jgi:secreted trypsin-like serine protease